MRSHRIWGQTVKALAQGRNAERFNQIKTGLCTVKCVQSPVLIFYVGTGAVNPAAAESSRLIWSKQSISAWAEEVKNLCRCQTM